jgi:anti-sigma B factor antagonist
MAGLEWDTEWASDRVVVALDGDLDISSAATLEAELERLEERAPPLLVLDLRRTGFVDSTGLSLILNADARAQKGGRKLQLITAGKGSVERILKTIGLYDRLDIVAKPPPG